MVERAEWPEGFSLPKMDAGVRDKWARILRSGKYRRARGQLRVDRKLRNGETKVVGHCCLGVLCEALKEPYQPKEGIPTHDFLVRIGLDTIAIEILTALNDGRVHGSSADVVRRIPQKYLRKYKERKEDNADTGGMSFREIAKFIKGEL